MIWNDRFPIGDCERVDEDDTIPIYRSYPDCEINIDSKSVFDEINEKYTIFVQTQELKNLEFTPNIAPKQALSNYYFLRLDFKIPRPD